MQSFSPWLESVEYSNLEEIVAVEGLDHTYVLSGYRFNYLAPDIVTKLLDGDYGDRITVHSLGRMVIPDCGKTNANCSGFN